MVRQSATLILLFVCAATVTASTITDISPKSAESPRIRHGFLRPLMYGNILGWIFAIKAKIVIVAVVVAIAMAWSGKFWGPGFWGCNSAYSTSAAAGPWLEEFPGKQHYEEYPGKTLEERSDNHPEVESLTSRVMKGLELVNVGYRAITEGDDSIECRSRLTCEAREIAKESPPMAKMLDIFNSTLKPYETGIAAGADCKQIGCNSNKNTQNKSDFSTSAPDLSKNFRKSRFYAAEGFNQNNPQSISY